MRIVIAAVLVATTALVACDDVAPVEAHVVAPPAVVADKPATPAYDATIPSSPGVWGPWATYPFGTTWDDLHEHAGALLHRDPIQSSREATRYTVEGYSAIVTDKLVTLILPPVDVPWGAPTIVTQQLRGDASRHEVWFAHRQRFERTREGIVVAPYIPLAELFGKGRFAFEGDHSLVGLAAADAIAQIEHWAASRHASVHVVTDGDSVARAIGHLTKTPVAASEVMIVADDGTTTPLTALTHTIDVELPMTEWDFSPPGYLMTRVQLTLDERGRVKVIDVPVWMPTTKHVDALRKQLAAAFGSPVVKGDDLWFGKTRPVCLPNGYGGYLHVTVGACH